MAYLVPRRVLHTIVAHEVRDGVHDEAEKVGDRAKANLARHRREGKHHVTVTAGSVDSFVNLIGEAAMSLEFGHWVEGKFKTDPPTFAQGTYILTGAADLDTAPKRGPRRRRKK